jgi:RNA-binding protein
MSNPLSNAQKRYLRGLAHDLKPVVMVGAKGVGPSLLAELDQALDMHELLKVKVAAEDREQAGTILRHRLASTQGSQAVGQHLQSGEHILC